MKQWKQWIEASVTDVTHDNRQGTQAGETMSGVVKKVSSLASAIAEISAATLAQSDRIGQVEIAVSQMDGVTSQNAALPEEALAATTSLES
jgi:methyl-accepting chemotaxis protein